MPHIYNKDIVAVELHELVPRFWNTINSLQKEIQRYRAKPYGIKQLQRGGNGRCLLINYATLSNTVQEQLGDPRKKDNVLENFFEWDAEATRYYARFKRQGSELKQEEQERYVLNASVMQSVLKLEKARQQERIKMRGKLHGITELLRQEVEDFNNYLKLTYNQEHTIPVSKKFNQYLKDFKDNSYYSIIKDPEGTGKQNARKVDDRCETIIKALFIHQKHKPTPTEVARNYDAFLNGYAEVYNEDTGELYNPSEFKKLSMATIINYLNKWENKIASHHVRTGNRQEYMNKFKPHHQMELPTLAGSILSIDDRQPPFVYDNKGSRAWFYIGADVASQAITTIVWGKTKEGIIIDFYRQMLRNYTQWGFKLPFELECESSLNSSFKDTFLRPGVMFQEVKIEANNARAKYIERIFGKIRYELEKLGLGWIARPFAKKESNQLSGDKKLIIPYDILINERLLDIEKFNNMPHPEHGISRWDYFCQNQNPNLQDTNWVSLMPLLGHKTTSSCRAGYIKLQGEKRAIADNGNILTGDALIQKMKAIEGKEFDIYWLDANDDTVLKALVFYKDRYICEVMEMPKYNRARAERTPQCEMALTLQSAYVATVTAFEKTQRKGIENINIIDNTPKTVSNSFVMPGLKRYEKPIEKEVEILEDYTEEEVYEYAEMTENDNKKIKSWRDNF